MNGNRQMEVHYSNTGCPYVTENFVDFFDGFAHLPVYYAQAGQMVDQVQENACWSMNMNAYKYGFSGPGSTSYYHPDEVTDNLPRADVGMATWEYTSTSVVNMEEPITIDMQPEGDAVVGVPASPEECFQINMSNDSPWGVWQDDIDLDNMTYEELLDLGEAVGTQSRGLSKELISLLPTSTCKFGSFFSRKRSGERCVICQMRYKIRDKQMTLPCKHVYHSECITKWLGINKVCPVCNDEVFGEESRH